MSSWLQKSHIRVQTDLAKKEKKKKKVHGNGPEVFGHVL
jgi:hypothetical protein